MKNKKIQGSSALKSALFCLVLLHAFEGNCFAKQDYYIGERTSVNSEKQVDQNINAVLGLTKELFTTVSLNAGFSSGVEARTIEQSYGGYVALGYNTGMWGLDGSFSQNFSRNAKVSIQGVGGGITFSYVPGMFETGQSELDLLKAAHKKIYATEIKHQNEPLFWGRLGFGVSTFRSPILGDRQSELRQLALTLDGNVALSRALVLSAGIATFGYTQDAGTYATYLESMSTTQENTMIARSFQGLPTFTLSTDISWQVTEWDSFIPRLQETLIAASKQWEIAGTLLWRRRLTKKLYISPAYNVSVRGQAVISGFGADLLYQF